MTNAEKIIILKENIKNLILNSQNSDENYIFEFAKQQAKEMRIEISKGELKGIVFNMINLVTSSDNNFSESLSPNFSQNPTAKLIEESEFSPFGFSIDDI